MRGQSDSFYVSGILIHRFGMDFRRALRRRMSTGFSRLTREDDPLTSADGARTAGSMAVKLDSTASSGAADGDERSSSRDMSISSPHDSRSRATDCGQVGIVAPEGATLGLRDVGIPSLIDG